MSNGLVKYALPDIRTIGGILAASGFFADSKGEAQAVAKILAGQELGFGPMASMTGINIIKGRVTMSANLMAAAVKRTGKYTYIVKEHTDTKCLIEFRENGEAIGESEFTMQDAAKAGLSGGENWKKFPRNMLFARALSNGVKWHCPDILGGPVYTPDELGLDVDEEGTIIEGSLVDDEQPDEQPGPTLVTNAPEDTDPNWAKTEGVGKFLTWANKAHNMTKAQVAKALGVDDPAEYVGLKTEAQALVEAAAPKDA